MGSPVVKCGRVSHPSCTKRAANGPWYQVVSMLGMPWSSASSVRATHGAATTAVPSTATHLMPVSARAGVDAPPGRRQTAAASPTSTDAATMGPRRNHPTAPSTCASTSSSAWNSTASARRAGDPAHAGSSRARRTAVA
jgi:hypothetical protein